MVKRLLTRRLGSLPEPIQAQVTLLSLAQVESLGEALLDFVTLADVELWLERCQATLARVLAALTEHLGELPARRCGGGAGFGGGTVRGVRAGSE